MKILLSTLQYPTKDYPFAAFISMIAEEFARRGHQVTVVAPQSITRSLIRKTTMLPVYEKVEVDGAEYPIRIYRPKSITIGEGWLRGSFTVYSNRYSVSQCLKKLTCRFDIVYAHFWEAVFNVAKYCSERKLPLVAVSGEDVINLNLYVSSKTADSLKKQVAGVIGVSSKNIKESIEKGFADSKKSVVIPNGPDLKTFNYIDKKTARNRLGLSEEHFIVAFVGRFINRKGAMRVERAIAKINNPSIKAIFIGATMCDEDKSQEPSGDEILFKGILPHDEISTWLCASDVFVLPTLAEGCSNSIVEAMACGLPIISSDREFNYDVLDAENAILIDPLDTDQIAMAIEQLYENPEMRHKMGASSIQKANEISFEKRVSKTLTILNNLVK